MDRLNDILWLKCRLTLRSQQASAGMSVGTVLVLAISFLLVLPGSAALAMLVAASRPDLRQELARVAMTLVYLLWIGFPLMGYRISEFLDVTRLLHFPLSPARLFTCAVVASCLDVSSFLVYPFLAAIGIALAPDLVSLPAAFLVLAAFALHTFAAAQLALFLLVHVLNRRRVAEILLMVFPVIGLATLGAMELVSLAGRGFVEGAYVLISDVLPLLPPGVAADALFALSEGRAGEAAWHGGLSVALCLLTLAVGGRITGHLLRGAVALEALWAALPLPGAGQGARGRAAPRRRLPSSRLAALAVKEIRLLLREPQVQMTLAFYGLATAGMLIAGLAGRAGPEAGAALPLLTFSSIFGVGAAMMNSLGLEREGLRFLLATPVRAGTLLVGHNLGQWALVTGLSSVSLLATGWAFSMGPAPVLTHLFLCQAALLGLMGLGNLCSVVVPYRMPSRGLHPRQQGGGGHQVLVAVAGGVATGLSATAALLALASLFLPLPVDLAVLPAVNLPATLAGLVGLYAAATAVAATLLERRRERLLREVAD